MVSKGDLLRLGCGWGYPHPRMPGAAGGVASSDEIACDPYDPDYIDPYDL
jgi:hypothetical protein